MGLSQFDERFAIIDSFSVGSPAGTGAAPITGNRDFQTRLDGLLLSNLDTIDHEVTIGFLGSFVNTPIAKISLPAYVAGTAPLVIDVLATMGGAVTAGIAFPVGAELYLQPAVACTIDPAIFSTALIGAF